MHLLVPRSRSSAKVKVKYKGYISQKMAVLGAFVFHKHVLLQSIITHFLLQESLEKEVDILRALLTNHHKLMSDVRAILKSLAKVNICTMLSLPITAEF